MTTEQLKAITAKDSPQRSNAKAIIQDIVKHANNLLLDYDQTKDVNKEDPNAAEKLAYTIRELQRLADGTQGNFLADLKKLLD